jgi:hypothetical protein
MNQLDIPTFANSLRVGLFADRATTSEAIWYAYDLIDALPPEHRAPAFTALHVVLNTIARELTKE